MIARKLTSINLFQKFPFKMSVKMEVLKGTQEAESVCVTLSFFPYINMTRRVSFEKYKVDCVCIRITMVACILLSSVSLLSHCLFMLSIGKSH